MNTSKKKRLESSGWQVGNTAQFLHLSEAESQFLDVKLALATGVREFRERSGITQTELASRLGSSQSRVAKMEAADRSVSLDLMVHALIVLGATTTEIAKWIKRSDARRAA